MTNWPRRVTVIDVTPRDGLQDACGEISTLQKVQLIQELYAAGVPSVEVTSFVSPRWIPRLSDAEAVARGVAEYPGTIGLIPNFKGYQIALKSGVKAVTFVVSASQRHQQDNLRMSLERSLEELRQIHSANEGAGMQIRGAISCSFGSPYSEENITATQVARIARELVASGVSELGLADTVGVGTPQCVSEVIDEVRKALPQIPLVLHLHDRYGIALGNAVVALERGVTRFETALGGLGGCPYAPNAPGNLNTETFVFWMHRMGIQTGVHLPALASTREWLLNALNTSAEAGVAAGEDQPSRHEYDEDLASE
ncbi:MAG: hydroxymethylglutaryl-CoA lyase [Alicyclobacillus shizuokensis]|nr:hydroxymethylglutaryl-CoA lyase [Alicyclobacillus shizuokensis]